MKIEVNIEKKHFFIILSAVLILAAVFAVNAYNSSGSGGTPSNMGHSVDEIDWSKTINSNLNIQGSVNTSGDICGNGKCLGSFGAQAGALNCTTTQSAEFCGPNGHGTAACGTGYFVTGGGYWKSKWQSGNDALDQSSPSGEGWYVRAGGWNYGGDCWIAYARCCKLN